MNHLKFIVFTMLGVLLTSHARAQEFIATTDSPSVSAAEPFVLHLQLKGAEPSSRPDLSPLHSSQNSFRVLGQQQSSEVQIMNGKRSSSVSWSLQILSLQTGELTIPSIQIQTDQGTLRTQPLTLHVITGGPSRSQSGRNGRSNSTNAIAITAKASKLNPYKNERIILNYTLTSRRSLSNIQLNALKITNAVVEPLGEPSLRHASRDGSQPESLSVSFAVTPLKTGSLQIPAFVVQAEVPTDLDSQDATDPFDDVGDMGGDPLAHMQKMMSQFASGSSFFRGFGGSRPVNVASPIVMLQVQNPPAGISPWLPAENLRLSETWSEDQVHVGDPITRTITTTATGISVRQVPTAEEQIKQDPQAGQTYRVYSDQPVFTPIKQLSPLDSQRKEVMTFIPLKAGELELPAIKQIWFDTRNKQARVASLPARHINILPSAVDFGSAGAHAGGPGTQVPNDLLTTSDAHSLTEPKPQSASLLRSRLTNYFGLSASTLTRDFGLGLASLLLLAAGLWTWKVHKERSHLNSSLPAPTNAAAGPGMFVSPDTALAKPQTYPRRAVTRKELDRVKSAEELLHFLQNYSQQTWNTPLHAPLSMIFHEAQKNVSTFDSVTANAIQKAVEGHLYGGQTLEIDRVREQVRSLIFDSHAHRSSAKPGNILPGLNPS